MSTLAVIDAVQQQTGKKASRLNLLDNAVLLSLRLSKLGQTKKVSTAKIESDADKKYLRAQKKLMDCPEMDAVSTAQNDVRLKVYARCLPSFFREGMYFAPLRLVGEIDAMLELAQEEQALLVERIIAVADRMKADDKTRLGSLFNDADYPTPREVRESFKIEWNYIALAAPVGLANISEEVYAREEKKISDQIRTATDAITQVMRAELKEFVDWLNDRVTPDADGKKKILRTPKDKEKADRLDKFRDFLQTFSARNIAGDTDCAAIVDRAKSLLDGVDTDALKSSESLREYVRKGLEPIKADVDGLVFTEGMRDIEV